MSVTSKRQDLITLIVRLREHIERCGPSEGFEKALSETEAKLRALEEQRGQPPQ
jgi:hypothetical protein